MYIYIGGWVIYMYVFIYLFIYVWAGWLGCWACCYVCMIRTMILVCSLSNRQVYIAYGTAGFGHIIWFDRHSLYTITGSIIPIVYSIVIVYVISIVVVLFMNMVLGTINEPKIYKSLGFSIP